MQLNVLNLAEAMKALGGKNRQQPVRSKSDLFACSLSDKEFGFASETIKRNLSTDSIRILKMNLTWLSHLPPLRTMWPKQQWSGLCVADAYATGEQCGISGCHNFPYRSMFLV